MRQVIIRITKNYVEILCNLGHLLEFHKLDENFGGSSLEADLGSGELQARGNRLANDCHGFGHRTKF